MSGGLSERLARPELARLWDELVRRWASSDRAVAAVTLRQLTEAERRALADLLGADRLPPPTFSVSVSRVTANLGVELDDLKAALREVRGPWGNRAAERAAKMRERENLWVWIASEAQRLGVPGMLDRLKARGIVGGDVAELEARVTGVFAVLERLPASEVPLASFACDVLGDPHALDHGTWSSTVVLEAVAERNGALPPQTAEDARRVWASTGVVADSISSSVLCLGLSTAGEDPMAEFLRACTEASEPAALTMAQLKRWPVRMQAPIIYAFENPSMLAEAARSIWRGPPLVCTSGWPNVAVITLLRQISAFGTRVRYHGDFDPKGLSIAQMLVDRLQVEPWRMTAVDYEQALTRARVTHDGQVPNVGWDAALATSMRAHGRAVFEEDVREVILAELRCDDQPSSGR
jgi:uncharacterized protein (TIGR02679 family)